MKRLILSTVVVVMGLGCAHTRPEEMTADEHRAEAQRHEAKAQEERAQFHEGQTVSFPSRTPFSEPGGDWVSYNPSERHLDAADAQMRAAASHLAAANRLEAFEDAACKAIPAAQRAACPLLASAVTTVQETRTGVRLVLKGSVDANDTSQRLNCHLAYAYASGFDRPSCPLFVKGMKIQVAEPGVLDLASTDAEVARKIQTEARRIFGGPAVTPVSSR